VTAEISTAAFTRLAEALNHARDRAYQVPVFTDDVRVVRYQPGERATAVAAQAFAGRDEVARWFARTPPIARFGLAGAPWPEPDGAWGVAYTMDADDFHNGGIWIARLAADGRIAALAHHPFALRAPA
jgi:hypothetical protein